MELSHQYAEQLIEDIYERSEDTGEYTVDTIYFGGGTPSLLSCSDFAEITKALNYAFYIEKGAEFTVEVNPATVDQRKIDTYSECGVNRISIGMQTRNEEELKKIGRIHTNADFDHTYCALRSCGIENVSVDVMYALPGQSVAALSETLDFIISLSPEHVSSYCLKLEPGTPMYDSGVLLPDEDTQYAMYELMTDKLSFSGYEHYEISNFAKRGYASRHNLKYWQMGEYLGFGPAAYSFFGGKRYGYERDLGGYLHGECEMTDIDALDEKTYNFERIMLGLRLSSGVPVSLLDRTKVQKLVDEGLGRINGDQFSLTTKGFFVNNEIICYLTD